jgi:hypothetical protein
MIEVESGGNSSHWVRKIQDGCRQTLTELGRAAGRGVQPMREVESGGNASHWVRKSKMAAARYLLSAEEQLVEECS